MDFFRGSKCTQVEHCAQSTEITHSRAAFVRN